MNIYFEHEFETDIDELRRRMAIIKFKSDWNI